MFTNRLGRHYPSTHITHNKWIGCDVLQSGNFSFKLGESRIFRKVQEISEDFIGTSYEVTIEKSWSRQLLKS